MILDDEKDPKQEPQTPETESMVTAKEQVEALVEETVETPTAETVELPAEETAVEVAAETTPEAPVEVPEVEVVLETQDEEAPLVEAVLETEDEQEVPANGNEESETSNDDTPQVSASPALSEISLSDDDEEDDFEIPDSLLMIAGGAHDDFNWNIDKRGARCTPNRIA